MTYRKSNRSRAIPAPRPTWQAALIVAVSLSALWVLTLTTGHALLTLF